MKFRFLRDKVWAVKEKERAGWEGKRSESEKSWELFLLKLLVKPGDQIAKQR